jgi:hypothetical protein
MGRFMSADPLAGDPSDPQSLNLYSYVRNNAVNLIDPSGLCFESLGSERCGGFKFVFTWSWGADHEDDGNPPLHPYPTFPPMRASPAPHVAYGILPGETAGVPDWLGGSSYSQWLIIQNFQRSSIGPVILPPGFKIQMWVFALWHRGAQYAKSAKKTLKTWPSYGTSACQVYSDSGRPDLAGLCGRIFGSSVWDSARGCLQQYYNPDFYKGVGGYENRPGERKKHSLWDAWGYGTVGLKAHAICVPSGLILQ